MIGKLITTFFNFLLTIIMSIVQLICLPLNALFSGLFPDFSSKLQQIGEGLELAFSGVSWALSTVPTILADTLLFVFTIELSLLMIMRSTRMTSKVWSILQKLKFW